MATKPSMPSKPGSTYKPASSPAKPGTGPVKK